MMNNKIAQELIILRHQRLVHNALLHHHKLYQNINSIHHRVIWFNNNFQPIDCNNQTLDCSHSNINCNKEFK